MDSHKLLATTGDHCSRTAFAEYIQKNLALRELRYSSSSSTNALNPATMITPHACAHYIRHELAKALRTRGAHRTNVLLGCVDPVTSESSLYWLDYLGSLAKVDYSAHGYAGNFALATLDRHWRPDLTKEEARDLMMKIISVLGKRFLIHLPKFILKTVDVNGHTQEEYIGEDP